MLTVGGAKPNGVKEATADRFERCKPEELFGDSGGRLPNRMKPAFGVRDNEHTKSLLFELFLGFP